MAVEKLFVYLTFLHAVPILKPSSGGWNFALLVFPLETHVPAVLQELSQMPAGMFLMFAFQSVRQAFFFFFLINKT